MGHYPPLTIPGLIGSSKNLQRRQLSTTIGDSSGRSIKGVAIFLGSLFY